MPRESGASSIPRHLLQYPHIARSCTQLLRSGGRTGDPPGASNSFSAEMTHSLMQKLPVGLDLV
jgi:hypothetical protein